ncbi:hypothetical protein SCHPADRAFT_494571 [Schizopora paradoxa]|uniref:Uncharacterized protein n=1 Tax=Schizopora paradoxa TaxID=27342 RepID=A0A0H2RGH8_9AGAM|nr:hypothetical protein SCHPADRAFT_494571 [Schizopora paradoxa]
MFTDALSLALKAIATICENIEKLEISVEREKKLMIDYKTSLGDFSGEIRRVDVLTTTIVGAGQRAFDLLRSDERGEKVYRQLQEEIASTKDLLITHEAMSVEFLKRSASLHPTTAVVAINALGYDMDEQPRKEFKELLGESLAEVKQRQTVLSKQFDLFQNLFKERKGEILEKERLQVIEDKRRHEKVIDNLYKQFDNTPFGIHAPGTVDDFVHCLNKSRETAAHAEELSKGLGSSWVERFIGEGPIVADVCAAQVSLLQMLPIAELATLEPKLNAVPRNATKAAKTAQKNASKDINKLLQKLQGGVETCLERENNRVISLAFCGTAKAGLRS